jgi:small subunit ribosomal protein S13
MARISGVVIPDNKKVEIGLTFIFGIGRASSRDILAKAKVDSSKRIKDLTAEEVKKIQEIIEKEHKVEGKLRQEIISNIKRLKLINCWRGQRHKKHLPVRGQRTRVNTRTVRGNVRQTAGSGHRKAPAPK